MLISLDGLAATAMWGGGAGSGIEFKSTMAIPSPVIPVMATRMSFPSETSALREYIERAGVCSKHGSFAPDG
jgi:hypothetical protein